jgi:thiol-disulfide isomerase/thioredoxin
MGAKEQIFDFFSANPKHQANVGLYVPDKDILGRISDRTAKLEIKIFSANWCPDCKIQVPSFFSVILGLDSDDFGLEIIEVNRNKMDEQGFVKTMKVFAIPTFIFFRNGEELGRIIERPKGKMEEDILRILE